MPVPFHIHQGLCDLDFSLVDLHDFAQLLYNKYKQSIFKPLQQPILPNHRKDFLIWFPHTQHLIQHVNFDFCEFMRQKVLLINGFTLENGCYISKKQLCDINEFL